MAWLFSIRTKLFALVLAAFLVVIVGSYWQVGQKAASVAQSTIDRSLSQSSKILDTRIESRFLFIREIANGIAKDGRVLPLVFDQDTPTLQDLSLEFQRTYDFDVLFFMAASGEIIARADQPGAIGINLAGRTSLFDDALAGEVATGFIVSQGKLMQTVAAPVFDNVADDIVRGVVVLSYELSKTTAEEIVSLTQSEIGLYIFTRDERRVIDGVALSYMSSQPLAEKLSDFFAQNPAAWIDIVESDLDEFRTVLMVEGQRQHSVIRRVNSRDGNTLGFAVAMRSERELIEPFSEIQQRVLLTGVIGLLVASVLALIMALGLSRPIIRLVELTKRIEQGDYPDTASHKATRDEVGMLQKALLQMGNGLREKAELETYLADIANDLDDVAVDLPEGTLGVDASEIQAPADNAHSADDKTLVTVTPGQKRPPATGIVDKRYKLLKSLGSGALGSVYLAHDLELDEKIALKLLARDVFDKMPGFNLKEEIRLARRVTHRNIVRTFDFGLFGDQYYITMEYVPGIDLGQLISRTGAVTPHIGVAIAKQICAAMMAAHEMGIIHRDLKPANMMINRRGILQIMDFGLAMQVKSPVDGKASTVQKKQQKNLIMGTPRFMAPEQFLGVMSLDERTDIYAIGIIMFTLFNAVPPFSGTDINDLAKKHFKAKVPDFLERSGPVPAPLKNIVYRALAKKPADRFQSVREMLDALNKL